MNLNDIKLGWLHRYHDSFHEAEVMVVTFHPDDGACLIIEFIEDGDVTGKLAYSEASNLAPL